MARPYSLSHMTKITARFKLGKALQIIPLQNERTNDLSTLYVTFGMLAAPCTVCSNDDPTLIMIKFDSGKILKT